MGELKIKISDDVERAFRKMAMRKFGYKKGAISGASQEAIEEWMLSSESDQKGQFWDSLEGVMKSVNKKSVKLQHEAWKGIAEKHSIKHKKKNDN